MPMQIPSQTQRRFTACVLFVLAMRWIEPTSAFNLHMTYEPPVKSSVNKLRGNNHLSSSNASTARRRGAPRASAGVAASDAQAQRPVASFQDRMRNLVLGSDTTATKVRTPATGIAARNQRPSLPPNTRHVETLADYKRVVGDATQTVCVRFYAPWCKSCKAAEPMFFRLATKYPSVLFVNVPVTEKNANLHQGLGVPSLPFGHIYVPGGGLVEELRITRPFLGNLSQILDSYVKGYCDLSKVSDCSNPYLLEAQSA